MAQMRLFLTMTQRRWFPLAMKLAVIGAIAGFWTVEVAAKWLVANGMKFGFSSVDPDEAAR